MMVEFAWAEPHHGPDGAINGIIVAVRGDFAGGRRERSIEVIGYPDDVCVTTNLGGREDAIPRYATPLLAERPVLDEAGRLLAFAKGLGPDRNAFTLPGPELRERAERFVRMVARLIDPAPR